MLFLYNTTLYKEDLNCLVFVSSLTKQNISLSITNTNNRIFHDVHPYILNFFLEQDIVKKYSHSNHYLVFKSIRGKEIPDIDTKEFRMFINHYYNQEQEALIQIKNLLKLNFNSDLKQFIKQLQSCEIKGKLIANYDEYVLKIFNQDFSFKHWPSEGSPYFKDWLKRKELYFLENLIKYPYI